MKIIRKNVYSFDNQHLVYVFFDKIVISKNWRLKIDKDDIYIWKNIPTYPYSYDVITKRIKQEERKLKIQRLFKSTIFSPLII